MEASVESVKFLGVHLDLELRWNAHTDHVEQSHLNRLTIPYATLIAWGHSPKTMRVFALQRRAIRKLLASLIELTADRLSLAPRTWLYLQFIDRKTCYLLNPLAVKRMRRYNRITPEIVKTLYLLPSSGQMYRDGPECMTIRFFNRLPNSVRNLSLNKFKRDVKYLLFARAFYR